MKGYFAASRCAQSEFVEKKSRFITHVATVENATQAEAFIAEIKKKYPDARHNCWAYRVHDPFGERYSDDGEPQGTAGPPMLNVLQKEEIEDSISDTISENEIINNENSQQCWLLLFFETVFLMAVEYTNGL